MKHNRLETPAYIFLIYQRPSLKGKSKQNYIAAVKKAAQEAIPNPIKTEDIEVEVAYSTSATQHQRNDIDNVTKPTLDAMKGIAYLDDRQVRTINATLFDRNKNHTLSGRVEQIGHLFYSNHPEVVQISIYSDSRIEELGGENKVKEERFKKWEVEFSNKLAKQETRGSCLEK